MTITTAAGRYMDEEWYDGGGREEFRAAILAIEAEARDEGFAAGFGEALDDLHGNVAEVRAALLAELEAGVEGLPMIGESVITFRAAVLDLIHEAGTEPHVCRCEHMDADRNSEP